MTQGTQFLKNSKCNSCKKMTKVSKPYGYMGQKGNLALKGGCSSCNKIKSLPYTKQELEMEGEGIKKFFSNVWKKAIKPAGVHFGKNIAKNPGRALQVATQLGVAGANAKKDPFGLINAGMQTGNFAVKGKGVKIAEMTDGGGLYYFKK